MANSGGETRCIVGVYLIPPHAPGIVCSMLWGVGVEKGHSLNVGGLEILQ